MLEFVDKEIVKNIMSFARFAVGCYCVTKSARTVNPIV
jgi:hypothetical protein